MSGLVKLRSDLVTSSTVIDGNRVYTVKDPLTGKYFRLREPEQFLISCLDGQTAPSEVARRVRERFNINISGENVTQFIKTLDDLLFLENSRSEQGISRQSYQSIEKRSLVSRMLFIKIKAFSPGRFLHLLARIYRPLHNLYGLFAATIFIGMGVALFLANFAEFHVSLSGTLQFGSLTLLLVSIFVLVTLHEFAHAAVCIHFGGEVREIGFLLMYFQPCFYCDLSDAWLFEKKSQRLGVSLAGPFFQLIIVAAAVMIWRVAEPGTIISSSARMMVIVGWVTFFLNFNPLIKLDGYYLLSDWVDIPNLRAKAFGYLSNLLKRTLLGWPIEAVSATRREKRIFLTYGALAVIYTSALLFYILYHLSGFLIAKWGGSGLVLLIAVIGLILRGSIINLARGTIRHIGFMKLLKKQPLRLVINVVIFGSVLIGAWAIPLTHRVSGEVSVRPIREFSLSLRESGFLESSFKQGGANPETKSSFLQMTSTDMAALELVPRVRDGQTIAAGDTIAILTSNQITRELGAALAELERLRGKLSLLKAPPKREEVAEAEAQVSAAQSNLDQLVRDRDRVKELVTRQLEANDKLESATSAVNIARAELANKKSTLELLKSPPRPEEEAVLNSEINRQQAEVDYLLEQRKAQTLISPIGGIVIGSRDERVLSVIDNNRVELLVPVSDFDMPLVKTGQAVVIMVRSFPGRLFDGEVARIPETAELINDHPFFMVSVIVENNDGLLREGMSGYAKIQIGESSPIKLAWRKIQSLTRVEFWSLW